MREQTQHTLLGAFVLGALAIGSLGFLLMAGNGYDRDAQRVIMVFDGSVKGLTVGAPVALRGVNIGEVTDIRVRLGREDELSLLMEVEARVDESRVTHERGSQRLSRALIDAGLRAQLNNQSLLTGLLYIQLDFFPETPVQLRDAGSGLLEIPTIPSPFEQLVEDLGELNLPRLAADLQKTAAAMRSLTESEAFQTLPANANSAFVSTARIADETQALLTRLEPKIEATLLSTERAAQTLENALPAITDDIEQSLEQLELTLVRVGTASESVSAQLAPDSPLIYNLNATLASMARASRSLEQLSRNLDEQPQSLLRGRLQEAP